MVRIAKRDFARYLRDDALHDPAYMRHPALWAWYRVYIQYKLFRYTFPLVFDVYFVN